MRVFSLVSVAFGRGAAALKRSAKFGPNQLVLADGSLALDRVEAASIRFPALEDVSVNLGCALSDSKGFTDARRAPILAKLCTFTFVTKLVLRYNDIAVVPDAIGALTNLKELDLGATRSRRFRPQSDGSPRWRHCTSPQHPHGCPRIDRLPHGADDSRPLQQPHRDAPHHDRRDDGVDDTVSPRQPARGTAGRDRSTDGLEDALPRAATSSLLSRNRSLR